MEFIIPLAIVALIVWALWYVSPPRCELLLAVDDGRLRVVRGKSTSAFLEAAQSICAEFQITRGEIRGIRGRTRQLSLAFSSSIPPDAQQRLRNVWQLHR